MKKTITFTTGCAISNDMYYIACSIDEHGADEPYTAMLMYQDQTTEKWFYHELPGWRVMSTVFPYWTPGSVRVVYALDENGKVEVYSRNGSELMQIPGAGLDTPPYTGYVSKIRQIKGSLYVCGYNGQVYKKDRGSWVLINEGLKTKSIDPEKLDFQNSESFLKTLEDHIENILDLSDINGISENDLYVIGVEGFIAHYTNNKWETLKKITGSHLNSIFIAAPDDVIIVGDYGTVLRGNATNGFRTIFRKNSNFNLYGAASFNGLIYLASSNGLYLLDDDLSPINEEMFFDKAVLEIEEKDGVLWILCEKFLARFDGENFKYFFHPNNQ